MNSQNLRVRFAPSPTGFLHIGGARTCLFNWLYAKHRSGKFILRIEDTDLERSKKEYLEEILESIKWLGMDWDEVHFQSKRFGLYREYADRLIKEGKAEQKDGAVFFKYQMQRIEIDDLNRGKIIFNELPKNEEVIIKSDGSPTYNFSCVIDDALMDINCVIRGEDHISNTPKQILMYQALGFSIPKYAHVPLILSPSGGRLSKRFGATSIREYKEQGYLSKALANYLLLLGWSPKDNREIISLQEAKDIFDIKDVNKTGAVFSLDKLEWINGEYIRSMSLDEFTDLAGSYLGEKSFLPENLEREEIKKIVGLFQVRTSKLADLITSMKPYFDQEVIYSPDTQDVLEKPLVKELQFLIEGLKIIQDFTKENIEQGFRKACEDLGLKLKNLVHPVRVALTGTKHGAGLFETMEVLGKDKVIKRLNKIIQYWRMIQDHGKI
ncbi:MAG: glutamate--tRNA ligase [Candidatus Omnitrophica bacterium]|nr:glutamate--tRNA ligase [Candidatus Omnitrophota bacterium]